jgi:hypothetical protein
VQLSVTVHGATKPFVALIVGVAATTVEDSVTLEKTAVLVVASLLAVTPRPTMIGSVKTVVCALICVQFTPFGEQKLVKTLPHRTICTQYGALFPAPVPL